MISAALSAGLITAVPATGAPMPQVAPTDKTTPADTRTEAEKQADERTAASAKAKQSGQRVEVVALRTETDQVWANPSGTFTQESATRPVRVWRGGTLVPADDTLAPVQGGRLAPKAAMMGLTFSPGGNGPLAELTKGGRRIALSWPTALPKPVVEGDSATYPEVLPGVDLKVVANVDDFAHYVVVKTPEAAKNPALATLKFGLDATGLNIVEGTAGELRALDPTGQAVFTAPKPQMWAAGRNDPPPATAQAPAEARTSAAITPENDPPADPTDGFDPGAKHADLGVKLTGKTLELTPDQGLLTAADTKFPVVIDPVWRDDWKFAWTLAYKHNAIAGSASTSYWNGGTMPKKYGRVGCSRDGDLGNAVVCAKTFFQVGMSDLWDKQIIKSVLSLEQIRPGAWDCKSGELEVWDTASISKQTTWNNQPSWDRMVGSVDESYGGRNCPGGNEKKIEVNVTSAVDEAARSHWNSWTLGLKSRYDTVDVSWRTFAPDATVISTEYNTPPATPSDRTTDPSTPCAGGVIGTTDRVTLYARVDDAEDNNLTAEFHYWKDGANTGPTVIKRGVSRGTIAAAEIDATALDGTYRWDVRVSDGFVDSRWAGQCLFTVDRNRPSELPNVSSAEFPANNPDNPTPVRTTGTFNFTANGVTDIVKYRWWTDSDPMVREVAAAGQGGPASITFKPTITGPNHLYVRSVDIAGNLSDVRNHLYYAKRSPDRDKPGDLNGDGNVDLWNLNATTKGVDARPGQGDGTFGSPVSAGGGPFAGTVSLAHRGTWNADYYEDLVALQQAPDNERKRLYVYRGRGDGSLEPSDSTRITLRVKKPDTNDHWGAASQILVINSVNDDSATPNGIDATDYPDLLVQEGANLWLYLGNPAGTLDQRFDAISLGNADWANMTLIAPGDLNADGLPEIWARDKNTGKIHQYTSRRKTTDSATDGNPTELDLTVYADPAVRTTSIGSGFTGDAYELVSSDGDYEKDGFADLWAQDPTGKIVEFPGRALTGGSAFGAARSVAPGTPWSECESFGPAGGAAFQLCGPVLTKYRAADAATRGYPVADMKVAPDLVGRYAHLKRPNGTYWSIYWHSTTGAKSVSGPIRDKWEALGWETGEMGYPTDDDHTIGIGSAQVATFKGSGGYGAIYSTPELGTWSIHGGIYEKYLALGGPAELGFPTTDESAVPGNTGRYNHFRKLSETGNSASIYWNAGTGEAWSVRGPIRAKWASLQWEQGYLGYPVTDEFTVHNGDRRVSFQGGYIRLNPTTGAYLDHHPEDRTADLRTDLSGDFNGDGRADLLTVYNYGNDTSAFHTLIARPGGGYNAPFNAWTAHVGWMRYESTKWVTGDFNGDGRDDVAGLYGYGDGSNRLFTFLAKPDGTFADGVDSAYVGPGNWDWSKAVFLAGDFNGDGRDDTAMLYDHDGGSTGAYTWTAKPDGTFNNSFASWRSNPGNWYWNSAKYVVGDYNGDGRDDIAGMYGYYSGAVAFHTILARPDGGFDVPFESWRTDPGNWDWSRVKLTSGDYNGDGKADAAAMYDYGNGHSALFTFLGKPDGSGGLQADVKSWDTAEGGWWGISAGLPVTGDQNADGRDDISIMYNYQNGATTAFLFTARTDGGFDSPNDAWQAAPGFW
ncbi:FG-GAP-like repeat-containing protein [Embleya sp. NPDC059259]|uniref:FG-GAP-like repeat-containing protein n=1 Tax=unclassified Embleya TaxID=2699296 RepID=UPI0036BA620D